VQCEIALQLGLGSRSRDVIVGRSRGADLRLDLHPRVAAVGRLAAHLDAMVELFVEIFVGDECVLQAAFVIGQQVAAARISGEAAADGDLLAILDLDLSLSS
jgi:hypothetical protein